MKKYIFVLAAFLPLILLSCDDGKLDGGNGISIGTTVNGKVTWYAGYNAESVAYYAPEIESG